MNIPPNSYNPSLTTHLGRPWLTVRAHDRGDWRTSIYLAEASDDFKVAAVAKIGMPEQYAECSHEDARAFSFQNRLWMSWTISRYPSADFRCVVAYGELVPDGAGWKVGKYFIPKYGRNDFSGLEKNFVFWEA